VPDWTAWANDAGAVPTECVGGDTGTPSPFATQRPNVTLFDPAFGAPRSWRASLGVSRRIRERYNVSLDGSYALGTSLYGVTDLNLDGTPEFTLATEAGRPVFVPASTIVASTGATSVLGSRKNAEFAHVFEVDSRLQSRAQQLTASVGGLLARPAMFFNLSYTLMHATDMSSFSGGNAFGGGFGGGGGSALGGFSSPTTAGDPTVREWSRSDFDRRHSIVGTFTWPARPWLDVTGVARASSGAPYTPRVGGDINGDGARNDRAFIFDPSTATDTALANGMRRLLDASSSRVRDCLQGQTGRVAARNSCSGPWYPSLDLQANFRPNLPRGVGRRLMLSVSTLNLLAGVDQLVHGGSNMSGWGQPARTDGTLLYVRGFDAQRQAYVYQVNERFGDARSARTAFFAPFQLAVQARFQVGPDRQREMMQQMLRGLRDTTRRATPAAPGVARGPGGGPGNFDLRTMLERAAPNPATALLERRDTLQLDAKQVARLEAIRDSLKAQTDSMFNALAAQLEKAGDPSALFTQLRPRMEEARTQYQKSLELVQGVLTPEQWAKVPEAIKNPPAARGGRQGQGRRNP
jgi:hypothetical protein